MRLYLPKKWTGLDPSVYEIQHEQQEYAALREKAGIPSEIEYLPKHENGGDLVEMAVQSGIEFGCVLGDRNFVKSPTLRRRLRRLDTPYAFEVVPSGFPVVDKETPLGSGTASASLAEDTCWELPADSTIFYPGAFAQDVAEEETSEDCEYLEWAEGTKETLSGEFARRRVRVVTDRNDREVGEETECLLIEKKTDEEAGESSEVAVKTWMCWGPNDHFLEDLVAWAHLRWPVERFNQDINQNFGAAEFQGRTWAGFHRHLSVVMLANAFIVEQRLQGGLTCEELPSFEEVMRLIVN